MSVVEVSVKSIIGGIFLVLLLAWGNAAVAAPGWQKIEPEVLLFEGKIQSPSGPQMKVWFYLPNKRVGRIPCVLIAPAGSRLYHGMPLEQGDRAEHLPYVRAGFAVVAYEVDGDLDNTADAASAIKAFRKADGGVGDAKAAIGKALTFVSVIDPEKLYVAGHSSAATLALQVAAKEPRIKGCIAYAPCVDVPGWIGFNQLYRLNLSDPGFKEFIERTSPDRLASQIRCPLLVFHADDDSKISTESLQKFTDAVRKTNKNVTFQRTATGGHFESMINEGIPVGIRWLKTLTGAAK